MSIGSFFKALLPFSWSGLTDAEAVVKQIAAKAEADITAIRAAAAKAQTAATITAKANTIRQKLAADVASLQSAISALTAQAEKDVAALNVVTLPTPPSAGAPASTTTGASGPSA